LETHHGQLNEEVQKLQSSFQQRDQDRVRKLKEAQDRIRTLQEDKAALAELLKRERSQAVKQLKAHKEEFAKLNHELERIQSLVGKSSSSS